MARRKSGKAKMLFIISLVALLSISSSLLALSGCKSRENEKDSQFNPSTNEQQDGADDKEPEQKPEPEPEPDPKEDEEEIPAKPVISQPQPAPKPVTPAPAPAPIVSTPAPLPNIPTVPKEGELKDMYYDEPGYYNTDMFIQSALVKSNGVHVQNKTVKGDFVIDKNVKNGSVYLDNILIEGNLIVESPNLDNLYLNDVQCKNIIIKDAGRYFCMEASGKSILDGVTTYDNVTFKEKNLHSKCNGFVNVFCVPNVDYVYTDITLDNTDLNSLNINTPTNVYANNNRAFIDTVTAKRKVDLKDGVIVRNLINYSADTMYYNEPTYIDNRGNASSRYDDKYYNDRYYDRYEDRYYDKYDRPSSSRYLYEPTISVSSVTNSWDLEVEIEDIDRRADYVTVKLYIDGIYQRSKRVNRRSGGYGSVTFYEGDDYLDLKGTSKEIRAYAVCYDNRYEDSDYAKWRSRSYEAPSLSINSEKTKINVGNKLLSFDYKYILDNGAEISFTETEITLPPDLSSGTHTIKVTGYLNDNVKKGIFDGKIITSEFSFTKS